MAKTKLTDEEIARKQKKEYIKDRYTHYSIELDCPPGNPRPNDLIEGVLRDTGLTVEDFETGNPFFGHQTWMLKDNAKKDYLFKQAKPVLKRRIENLYHRGAIRYGTW